MKCPCRTVSVQPSIGACDIVSEVVWITRVWIYQTTRRDCIDADVSAQRRILQTHTTRAEFDREREFCPMFGTEFFAHVPLLCLAAPARSCFSNSVPYHSTSSSVSGIICWILSSQYIYVFCLLSNGGEASGLGLPGTRGYK